MIELQTLGLEGPARALDTLKTALEDANGKTQVRLMHPADIAKTIADALAAPTGVAFRHGGEANVGEQRTTLCLAVRSGKTLTVGIVLSPASGAGPGRAWKTLQPWSRTDMAKNQPRLEAWAKAKGPDRVRLSIVREAKPTKPAAAHDDAARLAAVLANPHDDAPRAVFADELAERGDPRGEFISLQLQLAQGSKQPAIARRAAELLKEHQKHWAAELSQFTLKQHFHRGFVREVELKATVFCQRADDLFRLAPIEAAWLRAADGNAVFKLAQVRALSELRELRIDRPVSRVAALALAASPWTKKLERLASDCQIEPEGLAALLASMPALRHLTIPAMGRALAELVRDRPQLHVHVGTSPRDSLARQLRSEGRVTTGRLVVR